MVRVRVRVEVRVCVRVRVRVNATQNVNPNLIGSNTLCYLLTAPGYIVRLLMFWYAHQTMCVRWGSSVSSKFTVSNGVRQGGILSPFLFNIYMDDLSVNLKACQTGV